MSVAVLFARADSVYKTIPGCDVWDIDRDARLYTDRTPVLAHPPCRAWGRLKHFAKPRPDEKELAIFAVAQVRQNGGVLEHPAQSTLWPVAGLPKPGAGCDAYGGWTLPVDQDWWGHRAQKATWLYIVGLRPQQLPPMPLRLEDPKWVVSPGNRLRKGMPGWRPHIRKDEREHTPIELAHWLVAVARRCRPQLAVAA